MSTFNTVVGAMARAMGTHPSQPASGGVPAPTGRGSGNTGITARVDLWRGTSRQVCGLWPLAVGGAAPMLGVPLGQVINGPGMVCADHFTWFEEGLISAPAAMVLGLNGLGKSSLVRRIVLGHAWMGIHSMVLGDIKPDYVDVVRALGGQVIEIGHGKTGINPLDAGNVEEAARLLSGHPRERAALLAAAHERKKTMVLSLLEIIRRQPPSNREEIILDEAVSILDERGGRPVLADLLALVREAPERLRNAALDRGSERRYREITEELEVSLMALLSGRWGSIFAADMTTPMLMDRSVVFDVSSLIHVGGDLQAAVLLATWSYGFATVQIAQALADAGVAPRERYNLVMDELWRIMRVSSTMVDRIDALTRLNRTYGIGQLMVTHSLADFTALVSKTDRAKAQGFVERSRLLLLGGLAAKEMTALSGIVKLSSAEEELLKSWNTDGSFDAHEGRSGIPAGMGKFLLKTSAAPGIPFQLQFTPAERPVNITSGRWQVSHENRPL